MSEWTEFSKQLPEFGKRVLILFCGSDHIEDAVILQMDNPSDGWYYMLFDGGMLNCEPTHWQPLPPPPEQDK